MSPGDFHDIARNHAWAVNLFFCGLYGQWNSWRRNSGEIYWGIELIIVVNLQELFRSWEFEESFRRQYLILSQSNCGMRLVEWWEWREEEEGGMKGGRRGRRQLIVGWGEGDIGGVWKESDDEGDDHETKDDGKEDDAVTSASSSMIQRRDV